MTDLENVNWENILNASEGNVNKYFQNFSDKKLQIYLKNMCLSLSLV